MEKNMHGLEKLAQAFRKNHRREGRTSRERDELVLLRWFAVDALIEGFYGLRPHRTLQTFTLDYAAHEARSTPVFPAITELGHRRVDGTFRLLFLRRRQFGAQRDHLIGFLYDAVMFRELDAVSIRQRVVLGDRIAVVRRLWTMRHFFRVVGGFVRLRRVFRRIRSVTRA